MSGWVLVDVGGGGTRTSLMDMGKVSERGAKFPIASYTELFQLIRRTCPDPSGLAFSIAGTVIGGRYVDTSFSIPWLKGDLLGAARLNGMDVAVQAVNDGEAHAWACRAIPDLRLPALSIALGTGVAAGILGCDRVPVHRADGLNWDISAFPTPAEATPIAISQPHVSWALGSFGWREMHEAYGPLASVHYANLLSAILSRLTIVLGVKSVVLTGGLVRAVDLDPTRVRQGIHDCLLVGRAPDVVIAPEGETALRGLGLMILRESGME